MELNLNLSRVVQSFPKEDIMKKEHSERHPEISVATPEDVGVISELNSQFHLDLQGFRWDQKDWILEEIEKGNYFIFRQGEEAIGALCLTLTVDSATIETIAVNKRMHGTGIGKRMVRYAREWAIKRGRSYVTVESFEKYNLESFYLNSGFSKDNPYIDNYKGEQYFRFKMKIDS